MASDGTSFSPPLVSPASASKTAKVAANDVLMIVWARQQRRASNMCETLGFQLRFVNGIQFKSSHRILNLAAKVFEYFCKFFETIGVIILRRPVICIAQNPPFLTIIAAYLGMLLCLRRPRIIADCHNVVFREPWLDAPGAKASVKLTDNFLVHNHDIYAQLEGLAFPIPKAIVLETRPTVVKPTISPEFHSPVLKESLSSGRLSLLVPLAWKPDEPLEEIVAMGTLLPEFDILLTGEKGSRSPLRSTAPSNVKFTGFLSKQDYDNVLQHATIIVGLTTVEGIQMSVANEAVGAGRPMVLSGTNTTRRLFHKGAVYVESHTAAGIAAAVQAASPILDQLRKESLELRQERFQRWSEQAQAFQMKCGIAGTSNVD